MAKKKYTKGTAQIAVEVDEALADHVRQFARNRKETLREVVEMALRRHLANPPPIQEPPPLPPLTAPGVEEKPLAAKKGKKK